MSAQFNSDFQSYIMTNDAVTSSGFSHFINLIRQFLGISLASDRIDSAWEKHRWLLGREGEPRSGVLIARVWVLCVCDSCQCMSSVEWSPGRRLLNPSKLHFYFISYPKLLIIPNFLQHISFFSVFVFRIAFYFVVYQSYPFIYSFILSNLIKSYMDLYNT